MGCTSLVPHHEKAKGVARGRPRLPQADTPKALARVWATAALRLGSPCVPPACAGVAVETGRHGRVGARPLPPALRRGCRSGAVPLCRDASPRPPRASRPLSCSVQLGLMTRVWCFTHASGTRSGPRAAPAAARLRHPTGAATQKAVAHTCKAAARSRLAHFAATPNCRLSAPPRGPSGARGSFIWPIYLRRRCRARRADANTPLIPFFACAGPTGRWVAPRCRLHQRRPRRRHRRGSERAGGCRAPRRRCFGHRAGCSEDGQLERKERG